MPIKNLTNNHSNPAAGMRRLALVKKGEFNGKHPVDLDHFRIVWADDGREADPDLDLVRAVFYQLYGEEPTRFDNAFFLIDNPEDAFYMEDWIKAGGAGKLVRRCDGETQVSHYDFKNNRMLHNPIPCIQGQEEGCNCKAVGRLSFILKDVSNRTGVIGYFQLQLGGKHEIANISAHLQGIGRMVNRPLFTIPFSIFRADVPVNVPGMIKRVDKSLVHIQANPEALQNSLQLGDNQPYELAAGELPLEVSDIIEGEVQASRLADRRETRLGTHEKDTRMKDEQMDRPYEVEVLIDYLNAQSEKLAHAKDSPVQQGQAANIARELGALMLERQRHYFLDRIYGVQSSKDLTERQFLALKAWLANTPADTLKVEIEYVIAEYEVQQWELEEAGREHESD